MKNDTRPNETSIWPSRPYRKPRWPSRLCRNPIWPSRPYKKPIWPSTQKAFTNNVRISIYYEAIEDKD